MAIVVTQKVRIRIPEVIENFRFAFLSEDFEECALIKEEFYIRYNDLNDDVKRNVDGFISSYMQEKKLSHVDDMNNFFDGLLTRK